MNSTLKSLKIANTATKIVPIRLKIAFVSDERGLAISAVRF